MAKLPTPQEQARIVLDIYQHFGTRPGEGLMDNNFVGMAAKRRLRMEDIRGGLIHGYEQGWFEEGPNGSHRLTEAGYAQV